MCIRVRIDPNLVAYYDNRITQAIGHYDMTKIGLIGCGMWGRNLARNLAQLNVLAAVADRHDGNAAEFAAQFNSQKRGFDAILADPSIDGVVIATPAPSHDQLAIAALQAGKHTYVEKPLSLSLG